MFTIVTVMTIAIAVGANSAIFSVVNGILLKPLPYPNHDRLVSIWQTAPGIGLPNLTLSPSEYFTFKDENRSFEEFGVWSRGSSTITGLATPEQLRSISVTQALLTHLACSRRSAGSSLRQTIYQARHGRSC